MAIVTTVADLAGDRIVAVGRYMRVSEEDKMAEVAFLVRDEWQNRGIGRALLQYLIDIAQKHGIEGFVASVLADNKQMMGVFHSCGYKLSTGFQDGIYEVSFRFDQKL